jgi:hypothetical protein
MAVVRQDVKRQEPKKHVQAPPAGPPPPPAPQSQPQPHPQPSLHNDRERLGQQVGFLKHGPFNLDLVQMVCLGKGKDRVRPLKLTFSQGKAVHHKMEGRFFKLTLRSVLTFLIGKTRELMSLLTFATLRVHFRAGHGV